MDRVEFRSESETGTTVHLVKTLGVDPDAALARLRAGGEHLHGVDQHLDPVMLREPLPYDRDARPKAPKAPTAGRPMWVTLRVPSPTAESVLVRVT